MLTRRDIRHFRSATPETILAESASLCRSKFNTDNTPVIIPSRVPKDKKLMLAATLATLAYADVMPVVVPNGEHPETVARIAHAMGARVLEPPEIATKTAALQAGVKRVVGKEGHESVLFVDSDALLWSGRWAAIMRRKLERGDPGRPSMVGGLVAFDRGDAVQQPFLNTYRTLRKPVMDIARVLRSQSPRMNGANMGLRFDADGVLYENYLRIDPDISLRVDLAVQDTASLHSNSENTIAWDPNSLVLSPADRFSTWSEFFDAMGSEAARVALYAHSYEQRRAYDGTNLFVPPSEFM